MKSIIGWILIILGVVIVIWSVLSTYYNFTGQSEFPQLFQAEEVAVEKSSSGGLEDQIGSIVGEQIKNMIPQETLPKLLNMTSWIMFVTFLVFAGSKMVGMGASILRNPKKEES